MPRIRITHYEQILVQEAVREHFHKQLASYTADGNGPMTDTQDLLIVIGEIYERALARGEHRG